MKIGLKLWSVNTDFYFDEAKKLYENGVFDYIELYVVPNTLETIEKWKELNIPFTLHAPHFMHGVNLAKREYEKTNRVIFEEVRKFSYELNAIYTVVHSGIDGKIEETARQLNNINLKNILIENKPFKALPNKMKGEFCRGALIKEIKFVMEEVDCGFCLDVGHAFCSANSQGINPYENVNTFNQLGPTCYHLSDNFVENVYDKHLHFGEGNYDLAKIFGIINVDKNIAIETNKNSKENLNDFVEDACFIRGLKW